MQLFNNTTKLHCGYFKKKTVKCASLATKICKLATNNCIED